MPGAPRHLLADRGVTRREAEVLVALADRLSNADVAARLYLSKRTVESHVASLLLKLGARNRVELGDLAQEQIAASTAGPRPLPATLALLVESSPFVGRADALGRLRLLWDRARAGRLLVGLVAGEAGIGKSRLVAEIAAIAQRDGAQVLTGACFDDMRAPYQPFVQAISADVATVSDIEVRRRVGATRSRLALLVPELAEVAPAPAVDRSADPVTVQAAVFADLHGYLVRAAASAPLLLVVEDIHWATTTTLAALRHLARMSGDAPVLVLITTRDQGRDVGDDVAQFLVDLGRMPAVEFVELAGLDDVEVAALLDSLEADLDAATVRADTGGNPLFVREVATRPRRASRLDQHDIAVLELAAVIGPVFDADVLATAVRYPLAVVLESLERAEAAGLVARSSDHPGQFSFTHALFRAARYDDVPAERRMELHRQVAGALGESADYERVLPELARHASIAAPLSDEDDDVAYRGVTGEVAVAARHALRDSADRALALNDFAAAARAYEGALALWPADDAERPTVLLGLGRALFAADRRGGDLLVEARDGLLALGDVEDAAAAEMMLGELDWIGSRWDSASAHFDRASALVEGRPPSLQAGRVIADLARFRMIGGDDRGALRDGARALEMARGLGLQALEASTLITIGPSRVTAGDFGGIRDLEAGVTLAESLGSAELFRGYANLAYVYAIIGDLPRAREWRSRARDTAERLGMAEGVRWARAHDIEDRFLVGDWDEALAGAGAFLDESESSSHYLVTVCLRVRARVRLGRGNQIGGLADGAAALEFARGAKHPSNLLVALPFYARCLYEGGRVGDADVAITEALKASAGNENLLEPIETAVVMCVLGRDTEFLEVADRITTPSKRRDVGTMMASGEFGRAADMLAEMGQRSAEAYVRLMLAEQLEAEGRRSDAEVQVRQALAFHRSVGATAYVQRAEALI